MIEELLVPERRRKKLPLFRRRFSLDMTVSHVAHLHGSNANQIFAWRKQYQEGSFTVIIAGEDVVLASELAAAVKQIKELQRLLGKKTV